MDKAKLEAIEKQTTTPLKPDQSNQTIFQWIDAKQQLPSNYAAVLLCGLQGEKMVGEFNPILDCWLSDVGRLERSQVTHWAIIPDVVKS